MLIPVRCFTCGDSLGEKAALFRLIRARRAASAAGEEAGAPPPRAVYAGLGPSGRGPPGDLGDVLDALGVHGCCRTHLITAQDFRDHY